jgi:hypothetical protein
MARNEKDEPLTLHNVCCEASGYLEWCTGVVIVGFKTAVCNLA